jgi:ABC-type uncharacterized transport system fused permease/ATPase subunit
LNKVQVKKTWFQKIHDHYQSVRRQQEKKLFLFKVKLFLTIVLPIIIFALGIKVARTFIQIKIRSLFTKQLPKSKDEESAISDHDKHLPK